MNPTDNPGHNNCVRVQMLLIHPSDNIAVAMMPLRTGQQITAGGVTLQVSQDVPLGAKLALRPISVGSKIVKYGESIGSATVAIRTGDYVHTHNLRSDYLPTPRKPACDH